MKLSITVAPLYASTLLNTASHSVGPFLTKHFMPRLTPGLFSRGLYLFLMANYIATCRSNYFKVVDVGKFKAAIPSSIHVAVCADGTVFLCGDDPDGGGWPTTIYNDETDEDDDFDLEEVIASHLQPDSWCVLQEVGAEKLRYLVGESIAFNKDLEQRFCVSISDIYKHLPEGTSTCEY